MKKIMIVLATVAVAASVQASAFSWKTSATGKLYSAGTTDLVASATAYLFEDNGGANSAVFADYVGGTLSLGSAIASQSVASGVISGTAVEYGADGDSNQFFTLVVLDENTFFISDYTTANGTLGKTTNINMNLKSASQGALMLASEGFKGAGWYSVPEPTSGLLMLLGMAGLALRRRRA